MNYLDWKSIADQIAVSEVLMVCGPESDTRAHWLREIAAKHGVMLSIIIAPSDYWKQLSPREIIRKNRAFCKETGIKTLICLSGSNYKPSDFAPYVDCIYHHEVWWHRNEVWYHRNEDIIRIIENEDLSTAARKLSMFLKARDGNILVLKELVKKYSRPHGVSLHLLNIPQHWRVSFIEEVNEITDAPLAELENPTEFPTSPRVIN